MKTATVTIDTPKQHQQPAAWKLTEEERRLYARIPFGVQYVDHPSFVSSSAQEEFFGDDRQEPNVPAWMYFPEVPEQISSPARARRKLKAAEERRLFLRYNYARYRLSRLVHAQRRAPTAARAREMIGWHARAMKARAALVRANMALVLAMAKRTRIPNVEFGELISEGNMALLRTVEKFDVSRGFKFSTYSCRAILKSFNRLATKTGRYRQRFGAEYDPAMERSDHDARRHEMQHRRSLEDLREILVQNRADLSDVERTIILERFAVGTGDKRRTLAEVGRMVGLTNERVRQLQNLALGKIRAALNEEYLKV